MLHQKWFNSHTARGSRNKKQRGQIVDQRLNLNFRTLFRWQNLPTHSNRPNLTKSSRPVRGRFAERVFDSAKSAWKNYFLYYVMNEYSQMRQAGLTGWARVLCVRYLNNSPPQRQKTSVCRTAWRHPAGRLLNYGRVKFARVKKWRGKAVA